MVVVVVEEGFYALPKREERRRNGDTIFHRTKIELGLNPQKI